MNNNRTWACFLRGINVGGRHIIPMAQLRTCLESLEFANVRTYIQSGNVLFDSCAENESELTALIEQSVQNRFGFLAPVILRTIEDLRAISAEHPFSNASDIDPARYVVGFCSAPPVPDALLKAAATHTSDVETLVRVVGREVFVRCPDGISNSAVAKVMLDDKLKVHVTTRNWRTLQKFLEMSKPQ